MRVHLAALAALWALAFVVRGAAIPERASAGHGDVAAYYQVARNLHDGRGFEQDYVADRLAQPSSLPTPSNTWWRPLPSIVGWLGMAVSGESSYPAAQHAMRWLSACLPWVAYLAGWLLLRTRAAALSTGLLAVGFHLYLDQASQLLSHGPYALFGGAALLVALAAGRSARYLPWFGALCGLAYLSRGDAQVLPLVLAAALLAARMSGRRRPIPWRGLAAAAALFVLVAAPWWARNLRVFGSAMPPGVSKAAFAVDYEDWFSDPERLTWERYREQGLAPIAARKGRAVLDALSFVPACMSESVDRGRAVAPGEPQRRLHVLGRWVLGPLLWIGLVWLCLARRREALLLALHVTLLVGVYAVVFTAIGRNSFHSSLFSVYPLFLACTVAALELLLRPILRGSERARAAATVALAALLGALNVWAVRPHLAAKYAGVEVMLAPYRALDAWIERAQPERPVFYCRNPWQLSTEARAGAVLLPAGDAAEIRRVARTFGVTHLMDETAGPSELLVMRPGLAELFESGELEPVEAGPALRIFRLRLRPS